jgi:hypothetical protein
LLLLQNFPVLALILSQRQQRWWEEEKTVLPRSLLFARLVFLRDQAAQRKVCIIS